MRHGYRIRHIFLFIAVRVGIFLSILCLTQFPRAYGLLQHGLTIARGILRQHNIDKQFYWNDDSRDSTSKKKSELRD